jgi:hypothetical protein
LLYPIELRPHRNQVSTGGAHCYSQAHGRRHVSGCGRYPAPTFPWPFPLSERNACLGGLRSNARPSWKGHIGATTDAPCLGIRSSGRAAVPVSMRARFGSSNRLLARKCRGRAPTIRRGLRANLLWKCLVRTRVLAGSHRDDHVLTVFVVEVFDPQDHLILLHTELCLFANRQQNRMLLITGADPVDHTL